MVCARPYRRRFSSNGRQNRRGRKVMRSAITDTSTNGRKLQRIRRSTLIAQSRRSSDRPRVLTGARIAINHDFTIFWSPYCDLGLCDISRECPSTGLRSATIRPQQRSGVGSGARARYPRRHFIGRASDAAGISQTIFHLPAARRISIT